MKYALVQFKDGKRQVKYLVLSKDIRGFNPSCAEDIPEREYMVKWQDSFEDSSGIHDDGRFPAKILLVGATPEEIKAKASDLKIKLPSRFPLADSNSEPTPMQKPLRKQRRKGESEEPCVEVSKKRMHRTSVIVDQAHDQCSPKTLPFDDKPHRSQSVSKDMPFDHSSIASSSRSGPDAKPHRSQSVSKDMPFDHSSIASSSRSGPDAKPHSSQSVSKDMPFKRSSTASSSSGDPNRSQSLLQHFPLDVACAKAKSLGSQSVSLPTVVDTLGDWNSTSDSDITTDDEDDPTVLLDKISREHESCSRTINKLTKKNQQLEVKMITYDAKIQSQEKNLNKLLEEISDLRSENMALKLTLQNSRPSGSSQSSRHLEVENNKDNDLSSECQEVLFKRTSPENSSPLKFLRSSSLFCEDMNSPVAFPQQQEESLHSKVQSSVSRDLFGEERTEVVKERTSHKHVSTSDEFGDGLEGVTKRIEADLLGKRPLSGDGNRVYVGMGLYISKKAWTKSIRTKMQDSKFLKECVSIIWGHEALKVRTGQRNTINKKACTPKKVNLLHAMLRGKMSARGDSKQQQDFILQSMAPKWLTEKCYDSARQSKASKQASAGTSKEDD